MINLLLKKILYHPLWFLRVSWLRSKAKLFNTRRFNRWVIREYSKGLDQNDTQVFGLDLLDESDKIKNIANADRLLNGEYCLFSTVIKVTSKYPHWNKDYFTNYEFPLQNSTEIKSGAEKGSDIKCVWEINRLQFLYTVGTAYYFTKDLKYYNYYRLILIDWIDKNPLGQGPNWMNAMEVALRAVNIYLTLPFFAELLKNNSVFVEKTNKSLYEHGAYIYYNREIGITGYKSNHFLSDILGLLLLGTYFSNYSIANKWFNYSMREFEIAVNEQVYNEGINFEHSISYHRFVTEIFLIACWFSNYSTLRFSENYVHKLKRMLTYIINYTAPNGKAVQFGDCDDGRIIILSNYFDWDKLDHSYLLKYGTSILKTNDFYKDKFQNQSMKSKFYNKPGIIILRDDGNYLFAAAWSVGTVGVGNHQHNDIFSFELVVDGESFIVDPGTYNYTALPDLRNLFRSTAYHNTVRIDGFEINTYKEDTLFRMNEEAHPKILFYDENEEYVFFEAEHYGYNRLHKKITHKRKFVYHKRSKQFELIDNLFGSGIHLVESYFHLDIDVLPILDKNMVYLTKNNTRICIELINNEHRFEIEKGLISKSYFQKEESSILKMSLNFDSEINICYKIYKVN